ncbi:hypothetical protein CNMCM7691_002024 [Aspergillus felis]|uniref:Xaa-Pro dipeptidyl-peptidase C-terminal domain-containing protein n=1 Tax=Aspergillus felis TaxID=1287682 RepID=A0A8H6QZR9_9EURO|nr:hypothetical protein CNMCM7691_002024 [Aspergillus felis]
MSRGTSEAFFDVVEWCAEQEWSSGKVGLLGISYFAGTQWRVAARRPKGLAVIIPWEGMSDYYRDRVRHGGILSDRFIDFWWTNATKDTAAHRFMDEESSTEVPLLSVANWGGILLHLRGNVIGWMRASSTYKILRFIVGRHDLPFYYPHSARLQLSFLDAFLKDNDYDGWKTGQQPPCPFVSPRAEADWPIPDTQYTKFFLTTQRTLSKEPDPSPGICTYEALTGTPVTFRYKTPATMEITGHILARLTVSCSRENPNTSPPSDIDLFVTLRKLNADGNEVLYTGTMGDPVPIVKGWLRVSLRKVNTRHPFHRHYLPYRDYMRADETLVLEIAGHDTQGVGKFFHEHPVDRDPRAFGSLNHIEVGQESSYLLLPVIPAREAGNWSPPS